MPLILCLRFVKSCRQSPRLEQKDSAAEKCKGERSSERPIVTSVIDQIAGDYRSG